MHFEEDNAGVKMPFVVNINFVRHHTIIVREFLSIGVYHGISRTELPLKSPKSNVYSHFVLGTGHQIQTKNFVIIQSNQNHVLKISEGIAIHKLKPDLNGMSTSVPLNILN